MPDVGQTSDRLNDHNPKQHCHLQEEEDLFFLVEPSISVFTGGHALPCKIVVTDDEQLLLISS